MNKIGFLGPKGTFSHEAVNEYIKEKEEYKLVEFNNIPDIMIAVSDHIIDEAILPIENSLEGAVIQTLDMLTEDLDIKIKAELTISINQNLLVKDGTVPEDIQLIISHPQPLGQCRKYIKAHYPLAEVRPVSSTTTAAEEVLEGDGTTASIGSVLASKIYGLHILDSSIQDGNNNCTRFIIISKEDGKKTSNSKTSVVFSTDDRSGSLYKILDIFNIWDINMTRIESRPSKKQLGEYIFFVDINGHRDDEDVKDALKMVQRKTSYYKFLGSYSCEKNLLIRI